MKNKERHLRALKEKGYHIIEESLHNAGFDVRVMNEESYHWRVIHRESGLTTDFWPSTGRIYGNGIDGYETDWNCVGKTILQAMQPFL